MTDNFSNKFKCCDVCYDELKNKDKKYLQLWTDLCALKVKSRSLIRIRGIDFEDLTYLEHSGYVLTTDLPEHIVVKVKGHFIENGMDIFCIKGGIHE